jgi:hypothetical protein
MVDANLTYLDSLNRYIVLRYYKALLGISERSLVSPEPYLHYFGNESNNSILEAYGIISKDKQISEALRPKQCPNCSEPNKSSSKFCTRCKMVLTYDAYGETIEEKQEREDALSVLSDQVVKLIAEVQELKSNQRQS